MIVLNRCTILQISEMDDAGKRTNLKTSIEKAPRHGASLAASCPGHQN